MRTNSAAVPGAVPHTTSRTWRLSVPETERGQRLDRFLSLHLTQQGVSREKIKTWIRSGKAQINGAPCFDPNTRLAGGETVELGGETPATRLRPEAEAISLLYQDRHLAVLNKPPNLTVHPAPGQPEGTLAHRLVHHFPEMAELDALRPGIVHRIDKDTSGLLIVALTETIRLRLARAFADRTVHKEYLALVRGRPALDQGVIDLPIGRDPRRKTRMAVAEKGGRPARSEYRTLLAAPDGRHSLLAVAIHTGRTHQIRVHLSHMGHPIVGDAVYGGRASHEPPLFTKLARRQMLHAWKIGFEHPATGQHLDFVCPPPKDFLRMILHLWRQPQQVVVTGMPGCGKSSLLHALEAAGMPAWSADQAVARQYQPGKDGWILLRRRFGETVAPDASPVDRRALLARMRESDVVRKDVLDLIHPLVWHDLEQARQTHWPARALTAEVPLYLESGGAQPGVDVLVGVHCPRDVRMERLRSKRGWSDAAMAALDSWQWPEKKKLQACHLLVDNSGTIGQLTRQTRSLLHALAFLRRQRIKRLLHCIRKLVGYDAATSPARRSLHPSGQRQEVAGA